MTTYQRPFSSRFFQGRLLFLVVVFCYVAPVQGQTPIYPNQFSTFFRTQSFINPAYTGREHKSELSFAHLQYLGDFRIIRTTLASASLRLKDPELPRSSAFGLTLYSNRRGNVIGRSRGYLQYAFHTALSSRLQLSAGMALGFLNQSFTGPDASTTGSATRADGNMGLNVYNDQFELGIAVNQIFNGVFQPINETFVLARHYNLNFSYFSRPKPDIQFVPSILIRFLDVQTVNVDVTTNLIFQELYFVGMSFRNSRSLSLFAGIESFPGYAPRLRLLGAYNIPFVSSTLTNIQSVEISLTYLLGSFKEASSPPLE